MHSLVNGLVDALKEDVKVMSFNLIAGDLPVSLLQGPAVAVQI